MMMQTIHARQRDHLASIDRFDGSVYGWISASKDGLFRLMFDFD
jgi:hypothetical protein